MTTPPSVNTIPSNVARLSARSRASLSVRARRPRACSVTSSETPMSPVTDPSGPRTGRAWLTYEAAPIWASHDSDSPRSSTWRTDAAVTSSSA